MNNSVSLRVINFARNPAGAVVMFLLTLLIELVLVGGILMLFYEFDYINIKFDYHIPDRAKFIFGFFMYLFILKNLYLYAPKEFINALKLSGARLVNFFTGLVTGIFSLLCLYSLEYFTGFMTIRNLQVKPLILAGIIFSAFFIALIEELLFRNFLFNNLSKKLSLPLALFISSYIYAQAHFLKFDQTFEQMRFPLTGLFLVGIILAYMYYKYDIWLSIGVHMGWVLLITYTTINSTFSFKSGYSSITGDYYPIAGYLGIVMTLIFLFTLFGINVVRGK